MRKVYGATIIGNEYRIKKEFLSFLLKQKRAIVLSQEKIKEKEAIIDKNPVQENVM